MKTKQKIAVPILADREVFDYLKEKVGERKTKTEAFCDLLDKSLAGFVSPFLRNKGYELQPNQCHVTVSDLSSEWHWHRATVRSFLDVMEEFGLLIAAAAFLTVGQTTQVFAADAARATVADRKSVV